jgi:hypothetical protein
VESAVRQTGGCSVPNDSGIVGRSTLKGVNRALFISTCTVGLVSIVLPKGEFTVVPLMLILAVVAGFAGLFSP